MAAAAGNSQPPAASRVSVLVGSHTVPLFPGRPIIDSTNSPWSGIVLEKQHHGAIEIPEHEHNDFCIHLQTGGPVAFDWHSEGREGNVRAASGDLILLTPGTRDSLLWHGPSQRIVTSINPSIIENAATQLELRGGYSFANRWTFHDEQLGGLLTEMHREMSSGWPMGALYGDLLGMSLSIALLKKYASASAPLSVLKGGLSRSSLRRVLAYIEANLARELRLEELAQVAGLSLFHFARSSARAPATPRTATSPRSASSELKPSSATPSGPSSRSPPRLASPAAASSPAPSARPPAPPPPPGAAWLKVHRPGSSGPASDASTSSETYGITTSAPARESITRTSVELLNENAVGSFGAVINEKSARCTSSV